MVDATIGTRCSEGQEHLVPKVIFVQFQPDDSAKKTQDCRGMAVIDPETIPSTAFSRFLELMEDMGWDEKTATKELAQEIFVPLGMLPKNAEHVFTRTTIPIGHVFNVAVVLGIDAGWLAGQNRLTKEQAIDPTGLYAKEVDRFTRPRKPKKRPPM